MMQLLLIFEDKKDRSAPERAYSLDNIIGNGGFGTVYAGTRRKDRLPVSEAHDGTAHSSSIIQKMLAINWWSLLNRVGSVLLWSSVLCIAVKRWILTEISAWGASYFSNILQLGQVKRPTQKFIDRPKVDGSN